MAKPRDSVTGLELPDRRRLAESLARWLGPGVPGACWRLPGPGPAFVVEWFAAAGSPGRLPLRVLVETYGGGGEGSDPPTRAAGDQAAAVCRTLEALAGQAVPVPRPLGVDAGGVLAGRPAVLTAEVPGTLFPAAPGEAVPRRAADELARALARLHQVPRARAGLDFLPRQSPVELVAARLAGLAAGGPWGGRAVRRAARLVESAAAKLEAEPQGVVHGDLWIDRFRFQGTSVTGVLGWSRAAIAHPGADLGRLRTYLAVFHDPRAARHLTAAYEVAGGSPRAAGPVWDALAGLELATALGHHLARLPAARRWTVPPGELRLRAWRWVEEALAPGTPLAAALEPGAQEPAGGWCGTGT